MSRIHPFSSYILHDYQKSVGAGSPTDLNIYQSPQNPPPPSDQVLDQKPVGAGSPTDLNIYQRPKNPPAPTDQVINLDNTAKVHQHKCVIILRAW